MKILVVIAFLLIIASLASALIFMMKDKDKGQDKRTAKALTFRVGFSVALFIFILIANYLGWIESTGLR